MKFSLQALLVMGLAFYISWTLVLATDAPRRKFVPEWTKDKDGANYRRKMEIEATHSVGGNMGGYTIPLKHDTIGIFEIDENQGITIGCDQGHFRIEKNRKGEIKELSARFRENLYFDLDGDGMIDCFCDNRSEPRVPTIIFKGKFVPVEDSIDGFGAPAGKRPTACGVGRKVQYVFEGSAWVEVPQK